MVTLHRADTARSDEWRVLDEWTMASAPGNERAVMQRVAASVATVRLSARWREQLATAVAEATLNAMEHGNG
jgi:anti-sigma regulatory factor (Ser/Thr protein kinase)